MFQKKKGEGEGDSPRTPVGSREDDVSTPPLKPFTRKGTQMPPKAPQVPAFRTEIPRRTVEIPGAPRRQQESSETKKLTVGRDICLSGDITSCDKLLVEGSVQASLSDAHIIEIAETGFFKGSAEVDEADINGRFEGQLTVRERLVVRSHGLVSGTVRYQRLVVEEGGVIAGDMALLEDIPADTETAPESDAALPLDNG